MIEAHEYAIMKALLKHLYEKKLISGDAYSQTAAQLDSLRDKAAAPSDTTQNGRGRI